MLKTAVGSELKAHSGRRIEVWKSLRMMSESARILNTVSMCMLSLALLFETLGRISLIIKLGFFERAPYTNREVDLSISIVYLFARSSS